MSSKQSNLTDQYKKKGFIVIRKFLNKKNLAKILLDFKKVKCQKYLDRNGRIRRYENFYNKTIELNRLNIKILKLLKNLFKSDFVIFKDKLNLKPPGGEGFSAHYDGIFYFKIKNKKFKGWYEYANKFYNVLIPFDDSNKLNGTIQIAKEDKKGFLSLYKNTTKDGTPNLLRSFEKKKKFENINMKKGDVCIFSNRCAHRSNKNKSKSSRRILYYTYNKKMDGNNYKKYFNDKSKSSNKIKALTGEI
tara:strand:+ start:109 stop:849 length:741 start_codon:yes stop_codon:yes gene_type:complete